ncbi:hypothetical protein, partial [Sporosarcina sp. P30]|uniref:hypothetical protein n=2 Tax=Sporosarcina TaxID=1569 RepID=UPI001E51364E
HGRLNIQISNYYCLSSCKKYFFGTLTTAQTVDTSTFIEGGEYMLGFPVETFWWFVPWPFIWLGLATIIYFKMKKDDDMEEKMEKEQNQNQNQ